MIQVTDPIPAGMPTTLLQCPSPPYLDGWPEIRTMYFQEGYSCGWQQGLPTCFRERAVWQLLWLLFWALSKTQNDVIWAPPCLNELLWNKANFHDWMGHLSFLSPGGSRGWGLDQLSPIFPWKGLVGFDHVRPRLGDFCTIIAGELLSVTQPLLPSFGSGRTEAGCLRL